MNCPSKHSNHKLHFSLKIAVIGCVFWVHIQTAIAADVECAAAVKNLELSVTPASDPKSIDQTIQSLAALKLKLDLVKVDGTLPSEGITLEMDFRKKEKFFIESVEKSGALTKKQFLTRMKQEIARLQGKDSVEQESRRRNKEEGVRKKSEHERLIKMGVIDGYHAIFHKVTPGKFMMGTASNQTHVPVTLTQMPEIMATHMTQIIYKQVAELAKLKLPEEYHVEPDPSYFKGDSRPVESVSYTDVEKWTKALNALSELGEPTLEYLIPSHQKGMRYSGFMTEAQREYLMKKAKTEDGESIVDIVLRLDTKKVQQYAVLGGETAPVDQARPLFIDGQEFYGLIGNVWEWTKNWHQVELSGGVDPQGPPSGRSRTIRGGGWANMSFDVLHRLGSPPDVPNNCTGFRLVREVP